MSRISQFILNCATNKNNAMAESVEGLLSCPSCGGGLIPGAGSPPAGMKAESLQCSNCGDTYKDNGSWIDFMNGRGLVFKNRREKFFRNINSRLYTPITNMMFLLCGGARSARNEVMQRVRVSEGDTVLETGTGYGENFLWLSRRVRGLRFYGLDIQEQMLINCSGNLARWNLKADLVRADAQSLPYRDNTFDAVFHLGAINLFEDKAKAISEMIRVARNGTHIVIADETEKAGRFFKLFTGKAEKIIPPVHLVPGEMRNTSMSTIWRGYGYLIEFDVNKPDS
jgi:ubiquinone/menaquinone biosynthesis C-methylase UbiE